MKNLLLLFSSTDAHITLGADPVSSNEDFDGNGCIDYVDNEPDPDCATEGLVVPPSAPAF